MAFKKTDNCCRVCKHFGWGLIRIGQVTETKVCLQKPKIFRHEKDNRVKHYFAAVPVGWCEKFERKEDNDG